MSFSRDAIVPFHECCVGIVFLNYLIGIIAVEVYQPRFA